jgi:hypothetical protein
MCFTFGGIYFYIRDERFEIFSKNYNVQSQIRSVSKQLDEILNILFFSQPCNENYNTNKPNKPEIYNYWGEGKRLGVLSVFLDTSKNFIIKTLKLIKLDTDRHG